MFGFSGVNYQLPMQCYPAPQPMCRDPWVFGVQNGGIIGGGMMGADASGRNAAAA